MSNSFSSDSLIKKLSGRIIFLVGMMGSGKSSTGPHLAKALGYSFIDQDELIEKVAKLSISKIFQEEGETAFRNIETQVLKEIGKRHSLVVATGGGVVIRPENWGVLHQGLVVWIAPSKDRLIARLQLDFSQRPLLNKTKIPDNLEVLIKERSLFYKESDLEISVDNETPKEVANLILKKLPSILSV